MPPEIKIRNLDDATLARLKKRSAEEGVSFEGLLRAMISDATVDEITGEDWRRAGFEQVDEVVPGRVYEAWALGECYRISITRPVLRGSSQRWNSSIDHLVNREPFDSTSDANRIWARPTGIPARLLGETPEAALRDAMRWLANWGLFDEMGRARRDAEAATHMDPELRELADNIEEQFEEHTRSTWRDDTRASWSTDALDFFLSRTGPDQVVLMTYLTGMTQLAFAPKYFLLVTDVAKQIVDSMLLHMNGKGKPLPTRKRRSLLM